MTLGFRTLNEHVQSVPHTTVPQPSPDLVRAALVDVMARVRGPKTTTKVYEGTNQVQRIVMARQLLAGLQPPL